MYVVSGPSPAASITAFGYTTAPLLGRASAMRSVADGARSESTNVSGPRAVTPVTSFHTSRPMPESRPHRASDAIASAAVSVLPSWNFTPARR